MDFCLIFTVLAGLSLTKDPLSWISDYPPAIQERAKALGLIPKEQKRMPAPVIARKAAASLLIALTLSLMLVFVNGARTFGQGFLLGYGLWLVVDWYDALVIDCLWFCHNKRAVLPGTEDMTDAYHDYGFHMKMSAVGMVLGLPVCLLAGGLTALIGGML